MPDIKLERTSDYFCLLDRQHREGRESNYYARADGHPISLVVAIGLIYGFATVLSKRMLRLSKHITKVATGNLDVTLEIDGKDEIGQLSRQFNSMVASINELIVEVQESQRAEGRSCSRGRMRSSSR